MAEKGRSIMNDTIMVGASKFKRTQRLIAFLGRADIRRKCHQAGKMAKAGAQSQDVAHLNRVFDMAYADKAESLLIENGFEPLATGLKHSAA